ncbi:MAG: SRPBCC family protein [Holophagaceae bacterium]
MSPTPPLGDDALTDRDILTTRTFAAPREAVFAAWTDPAQLAQWWGPAGFTNTFETFDLRPGGLWRFIMHGPDGTAFPNESVFTEIVAPERIVFDHVSGPRFQVTATFTELPGGTRLAFRMRFATVAECRAIQHLAAGANEQVFDRLAALLGEG